MSEPSLEAGPLNRALLVVLDAAMSLASESPLFSSPLRLQQAGLLLAQLGFDDERASLGGSLYALSGLARRQPGSPPAPSVADRERAEMTQSCRAEFVAPGGSVSLPRVGSVVWGWRSLGSVGAERRARRGLCSGPASAASDRDAGAPSVAAQLFTSQSGGFSWRYPRGTTQMRCCWLLRTGCRCCRSGGAEAVSWSCAQRRWKRLSRGDSRQPCGAGFAGAVAVPSGGAVGEGGFSGTGASATKPTEQGRPSIDAR